MIRNRMIRNVRWCIFLLTVAAFFPSGLSAQGQTQPIPHETGFYYTVQKGDTLWDICEKFFDDPWRWPDLWGKNSQLANPHWIYPGDLLHLYQRDGQLYIEKVSPDSQAPQPVATPEPEPPEPPYFLYAGIDQVGFIRKPPVSPTGTIFKIMEDKVMASHSDTVYIRLEGTSSMPVGSLFTVYRTFDPVKDPDNKKNTVGSQHYLTGVVEVTRKESGYVLAEVVRNYRPIQTEDRVMPYETKSSKIYLPESPGSVSGTLLLAEEQTDMIGDNTIAFIDRGKQDGVEPGQRYRVYYQENVKLKPKDKKPTRLPPVEVGTILVLHTEQNTATVLVTSSESEFAPGTKFSPVVN